MSLKSNLILGFILCIHLNLSAQNDSTQSFGQSIIRIPPTIWGDFKSVVTMPFEWKDADWAVAALWSSGGGMVFLKDREILDIVHKSQSPMMDDLSKYILEPTGSGLISLPLMGALWAGGQISHNNRLAKTSLLATRAWMMSFLSTGGLKLLIHRSRPYESNNPMDFGGPALSTSNISFPSGHTATAFAAATVFATEYSDQPFIGIAAYSLAGLVGLSRIYDGEHWPSDVIFGAAVGYAIGRTLSKKHISKSCKQWTLFPVSDSNSAQICLDIQF
ncbi:MAG: phosphatase PAP2 family protein [Bacteroidales bacterium]|nr:phosphatase PAP2 family protein [Bacteroidales bacterium]